MLLFLLYTANTASDDPIIDNAPIMLSGTTWNGTCNSLTTIVPSLNSATTFHVPTWLGVYVSLASPLTIGTVVFLTSLLLGSIHLNLTLTTLLSLVVALAVISSPRLITPSDGLLPSYNVNE